MNQFFSFNLESVRRDRHSDSVPQLPGVYVACSDVFNDVASVAMLANGLVGFGAGIAIGTFELLVP